MSPREEWREAWREAWRWARFYRRAEMHGARGDIPPEPLDADLAMRASAMLIHSADETELIHFMGKLQRHAPNEHRLWCREVLA